MRRFLFALLFLPLLSSLFAQDTPPPSTATAPKAVMSFSESTYNFGEITEGEVITHDYYFTNTGTNPLTISDVQSSCGCLVPSWPVEPIAVGEVGIIKLTFYTRNKRGKNNQKLTLTANTYPAQHSIFLKGEVMERPDYSTAQLAVAAAPATPAVPEGPLTTVEFDESTFDFGTILEGERVVHTYTFRNTGTEALLITSAKGSCGCTVPAWPRDPIAPGETASLTVEFNSKAKNGRRNQKVTITANTNPPQSFIYLTGDIEARVSTPEIPALLGSDEEPVTVPSPAPTVPESPAANEPDPNCVTLFPNPTTDRLQLDMGDQVGQAASFTIFNQSGQLMALRQLETVDAIVNFDVSHYPAGNYVLQLQIGERPPETQCFVVKN